MRTIVYLALAALPALAVDFAAEGEQWWAYIQVLADDKMEGRNAGSSGHRRAAEYMAAEFERAGLKSAGTQGYFQPVRLRVSQIIEDQSSLFIVNTNSIAKETQVALGDEANLGVRPGLAEKVNADAVFCGYGLQIPEHKYDDLAGLNLKGKICVYLTGGPTEIPGALRSH